ncbi:MAG: glutamate--tRNA ligase [Cyclobacteriaceae bacterium]
MKDVRVRFAPSPTGALHIGGVRTALYNYLLAKKHNGTLILRIEDTDQSRFVPGAEAYIIESLDWIGIKFDEGPSQGGPHAPYRQSERKTIYQQYADQLIQSGHAYYAFDSEADLDAMRQKLKEQGSDHQQYGPSTRMSMNNSLTRPGEEVQQRIKSGDPFVIRFKVPEAQEIKLNDLIRGEVIVNSSQLDDKVLMKSDGLPTYHLANVVDDYLMKISHVIRGEEWLPSAPLHILLYQKLGWETEMPHFAHLPLLLKPDGNGKLSKRDADKLGFPIFPLTWTDPRTNERSEGFKERGYLPEALANFLAFLGWNPGTEQEIFSIKQLIAAFELPRINKAGARFDIQKAEWYNQQYLRAKSNSELVAYLNEVLSSEDLSCDPEKAELIVGILKERITFPSDFLTAGRFFFEAPTQYDEKIAAKKWNDEIAGVLLEFGSKLKDQSAVSAAKAKELLEQVAANKGMAIGKLMQPLRLVITGGATGPDLMESIEILGPDETSQRIDHAVKALKVRSD